MPGAFVRRSRDDLSLSLTAARRALDEIGLPLSRHTPEPVTALAAQPAVLAAIRAARCSAGSRTLAGMLARAHGEEDLLTQLAGVLLAHTSEEGRRALGLALRVEYTHPDIGPQPARAACCQARIQSLEDGWSRVRNMWRDPLRAAGAVDAKPRDVARGSGLAAPGEDGEAISAYFRLGDHDCAARAISSRAEDLLDLGRWQALEEWLDRLPPEASAVYPNFDYVRARRWRPAATRSPRAVCTTWQRRGMPIAMTQMAPLAACLVRAPPRPTPISWQHERAHTLPARLWRRPVRRTTTLAWSGCGRPGRKAAALVAGDTDDALASFGRAAAAASGGAAAEPIRRAGQFAMRVAELRREQESHREAEAALSRAEHQVLGELLACVPGRPVAVDGGVRGGYRWSEAPAVLKMPGLAESGGAEAVGRWSWTRLRGLLPGRQANGACQRLR